MIATSTHSTRTFISHYAMSSQKVIRSALETVLPTVDDFPKELTQLTSNLYLQSKQKITGLKPDEETARMVVCAHMAVEKLINKGNKELPMPSSRQAPLSARAYAKLLGIFRSELLPDFQSPVKTPKRVSILRTPTKASPQTPLTAYITEAEPATVTPSSSIKRRGLPKSTDPKSEDIRTMCMALGLRDEAQNAVDYGYRTYNGVVKERWGLLCGLIYVIASRAQPDFVAAKSRNSFETKVVQLAHSSMNIDKMLEWIKWSERIVGDQSWVRKLISPKHRPRQKRKPASGVGNMVSFSTF